MPFLSRRDALTTLAVLPLGMARAAEPTLTLARFSLEVTCPLGHPLMGGGITPAKEIVDPLFVHGFVLQGSGKPIVYAAVDWCEIRNGAFDAWRKGLADAVGTDRERVLVSSLHVHDAPISDLEAEELLRKHGAKGSICDPEFHAKTVERVAEAAKATVKESQPLTHIGTGSAVVEDIASNRRYRDDNGTVRYDRMSASRDPKIRAGELGTIDPILKTLSFWNGSTPLAALHAYATHPMSFYGKGGVSADFVGIARKLISAQIPGPMHLYVSGCSGNVTAGKFNDGDPANRPVLAEKLKKAMAKAWESPKKTAVTTVDFRSVPLKLEARSSKGFSEEELLSRLKTDARPFGQCLAALGLSWLQRVRRGQPIDVPTLDFGPAAFTLLPAESYVEFQLMAQKVRPDDFVVVAGYGECGPGYIPIERAWKENDGNLSDWSWIDPGSETKMLDAITKSLKR